MRKLGTVRSIYESFGKGDVPAINDEGVVRLRHYTDTAKQIAAFQG